jgi:hypothetical protein
LLVLTKKQGKSYIFFYQDLSCKNVRKTPKNHQEVMKIYFGIFVKSFDAQEVQGARSSGATSKKKPKTTKPAKRTQAQGL